MPIDPRVSDDHCVYPRAGDFTRLVIDGNDGTGKTTMCGLLRPLGHRVVDRGDITYAVDHGLPPATPGDRYVVLDAPPELCRARLLSAGKGGDRYHSVESLSYYAPRYREAAKEAGAVVIDSSGPVKATLAALRKAIGDVFEAPLCERPLLSKPAVFLWLDREGIQPPRLYALGFAHNNCGGGCVKAGQGHFAHLLKTLPERYAEWEGHEERLRSELGDVSILRDRRGGETKPMPLRVFRERIEAGGDQVDLFEIGGCGCFVDQGDAG